MQDDHEPAIVCLGGGVGTVQLLRGIRAYTHKITVVVSMADDGGSGGRLRRLYSIPPPGDLINCLAALSNTEPLLSDLLTFRFEGDRWGKDDSLEGQKLGNLMLVAMTQITKDFNTALVSLQRIFRCHGAIYPATRENVSIWAKTAEGIRVEGEEQIDLGKYSGKREIAEVHLEPEHNTTPGEVLEAIESADIIIAGPGDLYTTILPVLLAQDIQKALINSKAKKAFIVNIANKPFETPHYKASDYVLAVKRHLGTMPFTHIIVNNNTRPEVPKKLDYHYVSFDKETLESYNIPIISTDLVNEAFPIYHDSQKVAALIKNLI